MSPARRALSSKVSPSRRGTVFFLRPRKIVTVPASMAADSAGVAADLPTLAARATGAPPAARVTGVLDPAAGDPDGVAGGYGMPAATGAGAEAAGGAAGSGASAAVLAGPPPNRSEKIRPGRGRRCGSHPGRGCGRGAPGNPGVISPRATGIAGWPWRSPPPAPIWSVPRVVPGGSRWSTRKSGASTGTRSAHTRR